MGSSTGTYVMCPAGQWTRVIWTSFVYRTYTIDAGGLQNVQWQRASVWPPFWLTGSFNGRDAFRTYFDPYFEVKIKPPQSVNVFVRV